MWKLIFTVRGVAYKWTRIVPSRRAVCLPFPFFTWRVFLFFFPKKHGTPLVIPFFPSQTWDCRKNGCTEWILLGLWWGQALSLWCMWVQYRSWEFRRTREVRRTWHSQKRNWYSQKTCEQGRGLQLFKNQSSRNPRSGTHRQHSVHPIETSCLTFKEDEHERSLQVMVYH